MNKAKNATTTNLDSYLQSLYDNTDKTISYAAFCTKANVLLSILPKDYISLDSTSKYTSLSSLVKVGKIDIKDLHYIVDNSTFFEGFRSHILSTISSDLDTLKNRPHAQKSSITFDSLDDMVIESLNGQNFTI